MERDVQMPRKYVDLHVLRMDRSMASTMAGMGYGHVCVVGEGVYDASSLGITVHRKEYLEVESRTDLLSRLRRLERNVLVCVKPLTREALMVAARDGRVGTVMVYGGMADVDRHVAQVFKNILEITVAEIIECFNDGRKWRSLMRIVKAADAVGIPTIISSGASCEEELLPPRQLGYILAALKGVDSPVLDSVSTIPLKLLEDMCV